MSPEDLCGQMLTYSFWADRTAERKPSEIKEALRFFFTDDEIENGLCLATGRAPQTQGSRDE
jgi:hypothetical protein